MLFSCYLQIFHSLIGHLRCFVAIFFVVIFWAFFCICAILIAFSISDYQSLIQYEHMCNACFISRFHIYGDNFTIWRYLYVQPLPHRRCRCWSSKSNFIDSRIKWLRNLPSSQFDLLPRRITEKMRVLATSGLLLLLTWATQEGQGGVVLEPEPQTTTPKAHGLYARNSGHWSVQFHPQVPTMLTSRTNTNTCTLLLVSMQRWREGVSRGLGSA